MSTASFGPGRMRARSTPMDFRQGDTVFMITGYGPHVWAWGVQYALAKMRAADHSRRRHGRAGARQHRAALSSRPSCCARHPTRCISAAPCRRLAPIRADRRAHAVRRRRAGHERRRDARAHPGAMGRAAGRVLRLHRSVARMSAAFPARHSQPAGGPVTTHLLEDVQVWETVDPQRVQPQADGERGLTVCTNLNSESSPQLRFLVGDYAMLRPRAAALRTHPCPRGRLLCRTRRRSDQSARHQDVSRARSSTPCARSPASATSSRSCWPPTPTGSTS